jgi:hypothetical protein
MNRKEALTILKIAESHPCEKTIKRQYRMLALKHHPDKNRFNETSSEEFYNIQNAYELLIKDSDNSFQLEGGASLDYDTILSQFLDMVLEDEFYIIKKLLMLLIPKIINAIRSIDISKIRNLLHHIDNRILGTINDFFKKYEYVFEKTEMQNLSNSITDYLREVKIQNMDMLIKYNHIILNPLLDDLFQNNLYRLTENGTTLLIPLWHHELLYDLSGSEILVECYPILPENILIDEYNNIHVNLQYRLVDIWELEKINIELGSEIFSIDRNSLSLTGIQTIILKEQGISRINDQNIYCILEKSDIYVSITISAD